MKPIDWRQPSRLASMCVLLAIATNGWLTQATQAQFTSPPGQGAPKGTAGGGSRPARPSVCLKDANSQESLLAMAPTQFVGLTSAANPTLWVYIPNTTAKTLEFSLFTQEKDGVYQTNLPVNQSGLLKVTVPPNIALTTGKPYYWSAGLVCKPQRRTEDWVVGGWIQQQPIAADLQQQLSRASVEQRVTLYTQSGFWYEALNAYLNLPQTQSVNPTHAAIGANLLSMAGLSAIAPQVERLRLAKPSLATQASR